jgi:hypothetical protein
MTKNNNVKRGLLSAILFLASVSGSKVFARVPGEVQFQEVKSAWTAIAKSQDRGNFETPVSLLALDPSAEQIRKFVKDNYEWKEEVEGRLTGAEVAIRAEGEAARSEFFRSLKDAATPSQIQELRESLNGISIKAAYYLSGEGDAWTYLGLTLVTEDDVVLFMWFMHID